MVVFMLVCIPLFWALLYSGSSDRGDLKRTVRNPLVLGAVSFSVYLVLEFILMPVYPPDYLLGPAFRTYSLYSLLFPLGTGTFLFVIIFRRSMDLPREQLRLCYQSFMAGFLFLLSWHDLVQTVSWLTPVDLFIKPVTMAALFVLVSGILPDWKAGLRTLMPGLAVLAAAQLLAALGLALVWTNQPVAGGALLVPVLALAVLTVLSPGLRFAGFQRQA